MHLVLSAKGGRKKGRMTFFSLSEKSEERIEMYVEKFTLYDSIFTFVSKHSWKADESEQRRFEEGGKEVAAENGNKRWLTIEESQAKLLRYWCNK